MVARCYKISHLQQYLSVGCKRTLQNLKHFYKLNDFKFRNVIESLNFMYNEIEKSNESINGGFGLVYQLRTSKTAP